MVIYEKKDLFLFEGSVANRMDVRFGRYSLEDTKFCELVKYRTEAVTIHQPSRVRDLLHNININLV
jgi:hypothetical protein